MIRGNVNKKSKVQDGYERKMWAPRTPLCRPVFNYDETEEVRGVLKSGWTTKGPKAREFELGICSFLNVRHAIAVTNCTSALHLALMGLGVGWNDTVIIPDYTFPATGFAVRHAGASVVLCDVNPDTYCMDANHLRSLVQKYEPAAVIVVHAFGQCADMDAISEICKAYNVPIIEDAACALGAIHKSRFAGTMGDIGCFSLHARKGITSGEGGIVVTNNDKMAAYMRRLSEFGVASTWGRDQEIFSLPVFEILGYNYKMSDITAGIAIAQLRKISEIIKSKRDAAEKYAKIIAKHMPFLTPPKEGFGNYHIWQSYVPLLKPEYAPLRDWVIQQFISEGVGCTIGTYALSRQPYFASPTNACPVSGDLFDRAISLPIYWKMGLKHIQDVGDKITSRIDAQLRSMDNLKKRMGKKKEKKK